MEKYDEVMFCLYLDNIRYKSQQISHRHFTFPV